MKWATEASEKEEFLAVVPFVKLEKTFDSKRFVRLVMRIQQHRDALLHVWGGLWGASVQSHVRPCSAVVEFVPYLLQVTVRIGVR